ncbi:AMP-binding protein, partial [Streptomyces sp. 8N706]|uniref:AMP-binding protein n=1 Tax=Streptomyces sp. 8N706 TaxID=3457416 RepID=UPI003FD33083
MFSADLIRGISQSVAANAAHFADRVAFTDDRRAVGFAELAARTGRLAGHLAARGIGRGDRVALLMGNAVETVEAYLAVTRACAVGVPVNPHSSDAELTHVLADSGAALLICDRGGLDHARRVAKDLPLLVVADEPGPREEHFERWATTEPAVAAPDDLDLDEPAWLLYTSGTTGRPKGVLSNQRACLWSVAACYAPILGLSENDRLLWPLPLFHSLSHVLCVVGTTTVGASVRLLTDFEPDRVLGELAAEPYTLLVGVPAVYHRLVAAVGRGETAAPALRAALCTGAVAPAGLQEAFESVIGAPLVDSYGSTETCGAITMTRPGAPRPAGSCGQPVDGLRVRLVDNDTGQDVAPGVEGEVWVSGPNLMLGYRQADGTTDPALVDGWYRTGDIVVQDEQGHLTICGRLKDAIITGGENLHPAEVEAVLARVPGVADVAVAGRPHAVLGEVPVAYLVPEPGTSIDPAEALAACRSELSAYKVPAELLLIDAVPRTRSGKTTRHVLDGLPARLLSLAGTRHEALHRINWVPAPPARPDEPADAGWLTAAEADDRTCSEPDRAAALAARIAAEAERRLTDDPAPLVVHTRNAVRTSDSDHTTDPVQAAVLGSLRSVQSRHPGRLTVVDAYTDSRGADLPAGEPVVAIRDGRTLVPRLGWAAADAADLTLDADRTVLVTGEPEGAAGTIARHLVARRGAGRVLMARHRPGVSAEFDGDTATADLTDPEGMASVLAAAGPLAAAVHTLSDGPRAAAAWHLDRLTAGHCPLILFSSAAGEADDAFIEALAARRTDAVALAWGPWEAEPSSAAPAWIPAPIVDPLTTEDGLTLFDLACSVPDHTVLPIALRPADLGNRTVPALLRDLVPLAPPAGRGDELRQRLADGPPGFLLDVVRAEVALVLGRSGPAAVPADGSFREQGLTSATSLRLRNRLTAATGLDVPVTAVYDYPTPRALAGHLRAVLTGDIPEDDGVGRIRSADEEDPIVVVGMACRLPGGIGSPDALWELVTGEGEALSPFPADRGWDVDGLFDPSGERPGSSYVRVGGFLDDVAGFDADFFGISPREALAMDPQQRLLLESAWHAIEDAGIAPSALRGTPTGVFAGLMFHDYTALAERSADDLEGYV